MALTYSQLSSITREKFIPKLVDNIFASIALLNRMEKRGGILKLDGGTKIVQPVIYAASNSQWYSGSDTLDVTDVEQFTAAYYEWCFLNTPIAITGPDELKNSGDSQIISLVKSKTQVAEKTIRDTLSTGIYNAGTTTDAIGGLRLAISSSSTLGGMSQSTYSWWAAQVDSTTTTLSLTAMQSMYGSCTVDSDVPTVISTTQANYNRFWGLLQPQQRFTDSETAKAGFTNLMFNTAPVIVDSKCPTGYMYFLNEDYVKLATHKDRNFSFEDFQKPINQDARVGHIRWAGNMVYSNPRTCGVIYTITA